MSQTDNPYAAPDSTALGTGVFDFEGEVTRDDVISHFRLTGLVGWGVIGISIAVLLNSGRLNFATLQALLINSAPYLFGFLGPLLLYGFLVRPRIFLRKNDHLMGWIKGRLDADRFVIQTEHRTDETLTPYLRIHSVSKTAIFLGSPWTRLIPKRMFDDFKGASRLARQFEGRGTINAYADDLLTKPIPAEDRIAAPASAVVAFAGPLMSSDTIGTEVSSASRKLWSRLIIMWLICSIPGWYLVYREMWLMAFVIIAGAGLWLYSKFKPHLQMAKALGTKTDRIGFQMYGWVTDEGVTSAILTGHSQCNWPAFKSVKFAGDLIQMKFDCTLPGYVILNRRQFESDGDWEKAVQLVRSNIESTTE